jgi:hypothetical protein
MMFPNGGDSVSMVYKINIFNQYGCLDNDIINYQLMDGHIYANAKRMVMDYQDAVPESVLRQDLLFQKYLVLLLASEFAISSDR